MKILVDKNNILVIENPNIPQLKEYNFVASGYQFGDYDKGIIIYHKKDIKIINLKNLGDTMNIFYITKRDFIIEKHIDNKGLLTALGLFNGWDENNGKKYFFLPKIKENEVNILNQNLEKLGIEIKIQKTEKGFCVDENSEMVNEKYEISNLESKAEIFSFLFALTLVYGKIDIKNGDLIGIKIHIPLFGQYIKYKDELDLIIKDLQTDGIFLSHSIMQNNDGIVYQINSSDYEFLGSFANYYQSVEKIQKIFKQELTEKVKSQLINFVETNEYIPEHGREEVLEMIDDGILKILTV